MDQDITVDFGDATTPNDRVAVIATQPLTDDETWTTMAHGELLQFHNGEPLGQAEARAPELLLK